MMWYDQPLAISKQLSPFREYHDEHIKMRFVKPERERERSNRLKLKDWNYPCSFNPDSDTTDRGNISLCQYACTFSDRLYTDSLGPDDPQFVLVRCTPVLIPLTPPRQRDGMRWPSLSTYPASALYQEMFISNSAQSYHVVWEDSVPVL